MDVKTKEIEMGLAEYEMTMAYAGFILRESDLDDIAHYFEYVADETAETLL
jgi:hypothetical protein